MNHESLLYLPGLFLFVGGIGFVLVNLVLSRILRPNVHTPEKRVVYECGEVPIGDAWIQFNHRFYLLALLFVVFDVEMVLMFPWVLVFKEFRWVGLVDLVIFLGILVLGFIYAWAKGALVWDKPRPNERRQETTLSVPTSENKDDGHAAVA